MNNPPALQSVLKSTATLQLTLQYINVQHNFNFKKLRNKIILETSVFSDLI